MTEIPLEDRLNRVKMTIKKITPGNPRLIGEGEDFKDAFGLGKLGKDYDAEILINSSGRYMFTCICGATSIGEASAVDLGKRYLNCSNYGFCNFRLPGDRLLDEGPRIYAIKINK